MPGAFIELFEFHTALHWTRWSYEFWPACSEEHAMAFYSDHGSDSDSVFITQSKMRPESASDAEYDTDGVLEVGLDLLMPSTEQQPGSMTTTVEKVVDRNPTDTNKKRYGR